MAQRLPSCRNQYTPAWTDGFLGSDPDLEQGAPGCAVHCYLCLGASLLSGNTLGLATAIPKLWFQQQLNWGTQSCCPCLALPLSAAASAQTLCGQLWFLEKEKGWFDQEVLLDYVFLSYCSSFFWSFPYSFVQHSPIMQNVPLPKMQKPCEPASCGEGGPKITTASSSKRKCDCYRLNLCQPGRSRERHGDSD